MKGLLFMVLAVSLVVTSCSSVDVNKGLLGAAEKGEVSGVSNFLEKGADINVKDDFDRTALMMAAYGGHTEVVKILIEKGADLSAKGKFGATALSFATDGNFTEIIRLLEEKK